ncbi:hypothetical protein PQ478_21885 (plasmid) [Alkalihalophilus pseudofirmus]|uniref:hypothetical protein n=1 Tax=Alkalihalophilus pseudofirmus TaxID=79885 RepID=UPI00259BA707|nr:hypothetical protein [Alkalihalophilus pseudofirmus]WEG19207.1 hypothetical protein PQ478_21885 [Alkalihalophilus pseudofirmus]
MNKTLMQQAYLLLYEIENHLRGLITAQFKSHYGTYWEIYLDEKRPLNKATLTDLVAYFGKYPSVLTQINSSKRKELYVLEPIRLKIIRTQEITVDEYQLFHKEHSFVINQTVIAVERDRTFLNNVW